jgi:hypothetical protein
MIPDDLLSDSDSSVKVVDPSKNDLKILNELKQSLLKKEKNLRFVMDVFKDGQADALKEVEQAIK